MSSEQNNMTVDSVVVGLYVDEAVHRAFGEFERLPNVETISTGSAIRSFLDKKMLGISRRLFKPTVRKKDFLGSLICDLEVRNKTLSQEQRYNFLLIESPQAITPSYVIRLREKYSNSVFSLFLVNAIKEYPRLLEWIRNVAPFYDLIITCNKDDASRYGWHYYPDCYTPVDNLHLNDDPSIDVVFLGSDKGRAKIAHDVFVYLTSFGLKCDFYILGKRNPNYEAKGFTYLTAPMSYVKYLQLVANSRCILEITAHDEQFCTLRTMEAVTYHRNLLATNKNLEKEPFYDPEHMQIFSNVNDIDINIIKAPLAVDSSGDYFLPQNLLEFIREKVENVD